MKVVLAMESFGTEIGSMQAADLVGSGVMRVYDQAEIVKIGLTEGGEGTVDSLLDSLGGEEHKVTVTGALMDEVDAKYGIVAKDNLCIVEIRQAAGLHLVPENERNPMITTTLGVGQIIRAGIEQGCRKFLVGMGESATNDAGIGMMQALGYEFLDQRGNQVVPNGQGLKQIVDIKTDNAMPELAECTFVLATDFDGPLFGAKGAAMVDAQKKGASPQMAKELDGGLLHFAEVVKRKLNKMVATARGAGAAGGLGYAFLAFLKSTIQPARQTVMEPCRMEDKIKSTDCLVIGGPYIGQESYKDNVMQDIIGLARQYNKKIISIGLEIENAEAVCNEYGIEAVVGLINKPISRHEAYDTVYLSEQLAATAQQMFRLLKTDIPINDTKIEQQATKKPKATAVKKRKKKED